MFKLAVYISKYIFVLIIACFHCVNILYIHNKQKDSDKHMRVQFSLLCLFHIIAFCVLYDKKNTVIGIAGLAFFIAAFFCVKLFIRGPGRILWNNVFMLMDIGFIMLLRINPSSAERQLMWFAIGLGAAIVSFKILRLLPKTFTRNRILPYFLLSAALMFLVLPFFLGQSINGSNNWISIFGYSFQPSEIAKILFVLCLAAALRDIKVINKKSIHIVFLLCAFSAACVFILVAQRDLGGALIFFAVFIAMFYTATGNKLLFFASMFSFSGAAVLAYRIFPHIRIRVAAWLNPWNDIDTGGYQILQSLFAMGTWGPMGSGLSAGIPGTIPVVESDFIFAGITEEFGVFFSVLLICSFIFILYFGMKAAQRSTDKTKEYTVIGLSSLLAFQTFLIIGGCIKLIPITGVTLPFVSYGGSSAVVCLIITGMLSWLALPEETEAPVMQKVSAKKTAESVNAAAIAVVAAMFDDRSKSDKNIPIKSKKDEPLPEKKISIVLGTFFLFYIIVITFLCKFTFFDSMAIASNSYNQRLKIKAEDVKRGEIYDRNMKILAVTDDDQSRRYPYAEKTAHITGYMDKGGAGAESRYNFELQKPGWELFQRAANLLSDQEIEANSLVLTIDAELTAMIYDWLADSGQKGAVTVIEPSTGRVLAMTSYPSYNPNKISESWDTLTNDNKNSPLLNRASQGLYPPGSVFKIITAGAAMSGDAEFIYNCTGVGSYGIENGAEVKIHCYDHNAHGELGLTKAFALSCNTYFASEGLAIGGKALRNAAQKALFGGSFEFPLTYRASSFTLNEDSSIHDIVQTSIGQGKTLVSPLHMAMLTSAVANGGIMMQPYIRDYALVRGKAENRTSPKKLADVYSIEEASLLTEMMKEAVKNGTAVNAAVPGIDVAGKTGTAENAAGDDHGWFVAFAPADNPKVALAILLENSGGPRGALPLAKGIIEWVTVSHKAD